MMDFESTVKGAAQQHSARTTTIFESRCIKGDGEAGMRRAANDLPEGGRTGLAFCSEEFQASCGVGANLPLECKSRENFLFASSRFLNALERRGCDPIY
jgi:hypothetical protein